MWTKTAPLLCFSVLFACGKGAPLPVPEAPRPVAVVELRTTDPVKPLLLTGSAESWKEEDVSFEVAGRVDFILEPGTYVAGRWEEDGKVQVAGSILARIHERDYEIARRIAVAGVDVAREKTRTATVELEQVLPANRDAAKANRDRADAEYQRYEKAGKTRAVSEIDVIKSKADFDGRTANYAESLAAIETKKAEIKSLLANEQQVAEALEQAKYDLQRCDLHAPFSGEVSEIYVEAGGYAERGRPVAHVVMMTPIKVDLAVSREMLSKLRRGDAVTLHVPGSEEPVHGSIYEKGTVADPKTRTFRVSVITPNRRVGGDFKGDDPRAKMPKISQTLPLMPISSPEFGGMFFVEENRGLRKDAKGWYVWADTARTILSSAHDGAVLKLKKYYVTPGPLRSNVQGLYLMRELKDIGELKQGLRLPLDVPASDADEIEVVISRPRWLLKPGQLVGVLLSGSPPKPGLYVPLDAVLSAKGGGSSVFLAVDGKAQRVDVRVAGQIGQYVRVEGDGLVEGALVITDYIHFLQDGEAVSVIRRRELGK